MELKEVKIQLNLAEANELVYDTIGNATARFPDAECVENKRDAKIIMMYKRILEELLRQFPEIHDMKKPSKHDLDEFRQLVNKAEKVLSVTGEPIVFPRAERGPTRTIELTAGEALEVATGSVFQATEASPEREDEARIIVAHDNFLDEVFSKFPELKDSFEWQIELKRVKENAKKARERLKKIS